MIIYLYLGIVAALLFLGFSLKVERIVQLDLNSQK